MAVCLCVCTCRGECIFLGIEVEHGGNIIVGFSFEMSGQSPVSVRALFLLDQGVRQHSSQHKTQIEEK